MAWIYLAVSEDLLTPFRPGLEQSLTVNTTDIAKASYCPECSQGILQLGLYGTTCGHWRDVISLMSRSTLYSEDFHAKTSALRDMAAAWRVSEADFLERSLGLHAIYDQASSSWKTSQPSLFEGWTKLQEPLPRRGMIVDGRCYELPTSELLTYGKGGFVWPTPCARDHKVEYSATAKKRMARRKAEGKKTGGTRRMSDFVPGPINPNLYEWLMGYPIEWTALSALVTQWYRNKRVKRSKD